MAAGEHPWSKLATVPNFKDKVAGAMVTVATDSTTMTEAAVADAEFATGVTDAIAKGATLAFRQRGLS